MSPAAAALGAALLAAPAPLADWTPEAALPGLPPRLRALAGAVRSGRAPRPALREFERLFQLHYPFSAALPPGLRLAAAAATPPAGLLAAPAAASLGPVNVGGRTAAIALVPGDPDRAWVGAAGGGAWLLRYDPAGRTSTWSPRFDTQPTLSVGAIAVDPADPARVLVGTGEMNFSLDEFDGVGVIRSEDGGTSWLAPVALAGGGRIGALAFRPDASGIAFAGASSGLHRSTDGGRTWAQVLGSAPVTAVILDPLDADRMWIGVMGDGVKPGGILRSTSGGAPGSFTPLSGSGACTLPALGRDERVALAGSTGRLYAALGIGTGQLWRSDDGGDTWCRMAAPANLCGEQCWYDLAVAADPADPDHVLLGGIGLYRSTDGGGSFSSLGPVHVDHHALVFGPPGSRMALDANDGGLARIDFSGPAPLVRDLSLGYVSAQYYGVARDPLDSGPSYGGTQDNGTHLFATGSASARTLSTAYCGDGGHVRGHPSRAGRIFYTVCPADGRLHVLGSDDLGASVWDAGAGIAAEEGAAWAPPLEWVGASSLLVASADRVWRTTNPAAPAGSVRWRALGEVDLTPGGGAITAIAGEPLDGLAAWAGTSHGQLWRTLDGGASWSETWLGRGGRPRWIGDVVPDPTSPATVWLALGGWQTPDSGGHVWRSTDGGLGWSDRSGNLPDIPVTSLAVDPADPRRVWAGTWVGPWETRDAGATWQPLPGAPRAAVTDLDFDPASGRLRIATHGRGLWTAAVERCPALAVVATGDLCGDPEVRLSASAGFSAHRWSTGDTADSIRVAPAAPAVYCLEAEAGSCRGEARALVARPVFADVGCGDPFLEHVAALAAAGVTAGCATSPPRYCRDQAVTRAEMAVFLMRALGVAPPSGPASCFADVPAADPFAPWICELARRGITGGCATAPPRFCPAAAVSRAQMAVFVLRSLGVRPPTPSAACFADVAEGEPFAAWICELAARGITGGCAAAPARFCPDRAVTRGEMAVFLARALPLAGRAACATAR